MGPFATTSRGQATTGRRHFFHRVLHFEGVKKVELRTFDGGRGMEEILKRLNDIEMKLDALLYALMEEEDAPAGDEHGLERDTSQTL